MGGVWRIDSQNINAVRQTLCDIRYEVVSLVRTRKVTAFLVVKEPDAWAQTFDGPPISSWQLYNG